MRLVQAIVEEFGASVTYEAGFPLIQDASFFGDLTVPAEATRGGVAIGVRTSNFDELATTYVADPDLWDETGSAESSIDAADQRALEAVLAEAGYEYVPRAALLAKYDGANRPLKELHGNGDLTWWTRNFDWL
jgi:hypothetical protein